MVAIQLPNVADNVLALLGVTARRNDRGAVAAAVAAGGLRQRAVARRCEGVDHLRTDRHDRSRHARHAGGGADFLDPHCLRLRPDARWRRLFDDLFDQAATGADVSFAAERRGQSGAPYCGDHLGYDARRASCRSRATITNCLAGGLADARESRLAPDSMILSSLPAASFAGIALTLVPWLCAGGTLGCISPSMPLLVRAIEGNGCDVAILPGSLIPRLADAGFLRAAEPAENYSGLLAFAGAASASAGLACRQINLIDIAIFGEVGLCAVHRRRGQTGATPSGKIRAPQGSPRRADRRRHRAHAGRHDRLRRSDGAAPRLPARRRAILSDLFQAGDDGYVDTGYPCRIDPQSHAHRHRPATRPGQCRRLSFLLRDLKDMVAHTDDQASVAALPDAFAGIGWPAPAETARRCAGPSPRLGSIR